MGVASDEISYGLVARALHWSIALLILCLLASGFLADSLPKGTVPLHKAAGILVLGLGVLRVLWWLLDRDRPGHDSLGWQHWLAVLVQWALILLGLAMPVSGWLLSSAAGRPIGFFGLGEVPLLIDPDKALAGLFREAHGVMGLTLALLVGLHVAGALYHHLILGDGTLLRMAPGRHRRRRFR